MKELNCLLPPLNEYNRAIKDPALLHSLCDKNLTLGELPSGACSGAGGFPSQHLWMQDGCVLTWGTRVPESTKSCSSGRAGQPSWSGAGRASAPVRGVESSTGSTGVKWQIFCPTCGKCAGKFGGGLAVGGVSANTCNSILTI